jgi:hypothetical protein
LEARVAAHARLSGSELADALAPLLLDRRLANHWLHERLADASAACPRLPKGRSDPCMHSLVMMDCPPVQLSLAWISAEGWQRQRDARGGAEVIGFADGWTRLCLLAGRDLAIRRYRLDASGLHAEPIETLSAGAMLSLDNARESLRFAHVATDAVLLRLLVRDDAAELAREHDAATGRLLRTRQAQSWQGRIQMMLSLLRAMGRRDAVPMIAEQLPFWPKALRWHAVREVLACDASAGLALLHTVSLHDPDSELRSLALRTSADLAARYPQLASAG